MATERVTNRLRDIIHQDTQRDLVGASKAIHAEMKALVEEDILQASKAICAHLEEKFSGVEFDLGVRLSKTLAERHDKSLRAEVEKSLGVIGDRFTKELSLVREETSRQVEFLKQAYEQGLERVERLLEKLSIPAPQVSVNVPEQKTPTVNVSLPEMAPSVNVTLPELKAPDVTVNVPEQKAPDVVVNVPKRGRLTKSIEYDEYGRPNTITETEGD